jgi:MraZ protein
MTSFIGDYGCKVDEKGRVLFPAAFKKQIASASPDRFVVKKDIFESCLVLFPIEEWERQNTLIRKNTNPYNKDSGGYARFKQPFAAAKTIARFGGRRARFNPCRNGWQN